MNEFVTAINQHRAAHVTAADTLCVDESISKRYHQGGEYSLDRVTCIPSSFGPSRHSLTSLCHDNAATDEMTIWTLIQKRVSTPTCMSLLRTIWQSTSIRSFAREPPETDVQHFSRMMEFLKRLQEQLGHMYQHRLSLRDRVLDAISTQPFWANLIARNLPDADSLIDIFELLPEARHRLGPAPAPPPNPAPTYLAAAVPPPDPPVLTDPDTGNTCTISLVPHSDDPTAVYWTMRQFLRGAPVPYATRRWTAPGPRGPSATSRCNVRGSAAHWAAVCPRRTSDGRPSPPLRDSSFPLRNRRPARAQ